jgi:hypothetical protein
MYTTISRTLCTLFLFLIATAASAQLTAWQYRMPFEATDSSGSTLTNYQVRLQVNTAALVSAGHMNAAGNDIRFADSCGTTIYPHFTESGMNSANTVIWVLVPSIAANSTETFYMFYGNSAAATTSAFAAVFTNVYISSGDVTLTGTQNYDWFQVNAGHTVYVQTGSVLTINARNMIIDGTISGIGAGHQAPALNTSGNGPGAGTTSANSGSGGGSYGGVGGLGGLDAGDTPGNGGPVYGTATANDIDMGSSGGSGTTSAGNGGGGVQLNGDYIWIGAGGAIHMNGTTGASTASRGGGGGAGGGVLLMGKHIANAGTIAANGGDGATGTSTFNDGGGGGGGGRVKMLYTRTLTNSGTWTANPGLGGGYGDQASGQPGAAGTTHAGATSAYYVPEITAGNELTLMAPVVTLSATTICSTDSITATATAGYTTYSFLVNGTPVSTGTSNSYTYTGLSNGDILAVSAEAGACFIYTSDNDTISVLANSSAGTPMVSAEICIGGTDTLMTSGSAGVVTWYEFDGNNYNFAGTGSPLMFGPMNTAGTFTFVAVANNGGCAIDTSAFVTTLVNALPVAGTVTTSLTDTNLCAFDTVLFTANGSTGMISWLVQFGQMGPYGAFGNGNPFNPGPPSNQDIGAYNFVAVASATGCPDDTSAPLALYVRTTPEVMLGGDTTLCAGPLTLDAGHPGESYLWNTADTTQQLSVTASGTYSVTVTTMYGCSGTDVISVTINPNPVVSITGPSSSVCLDDAAITLSASPAGGSFSGPGMAANMFSPSAAGVGTHIISYSVTDNNGCTGSNFTQVGVSACVSVPENSVLGSVAVYPNPSNGQFSITVANGNGTDLLIEMIDISGRVIHSQTENNVHAGHTATVNAEGAAAGTYFLRITSGADVRIGKVIVE